MDWHSSYVIFFTGRTSIPNIDFSYFYIHIISLYKWSKDVEGRGDVKWGITKTTKIIRKTLSFVLKAKKIRRFKNLIKNIQ